MPSSPLRLAPPSPGRLGIPLERPTIRYGATFNDPSPGRLLSKERTSVAYSPAVAILACLVPHDSSR